MKSKAVGADTSPEILKVSEDGIRLLWHRTEHFLPFADFPWFREATIAQIMDIGQESESHLHRPELDVDLNLAMIQAPENYPLVSRNQASDAGAP